MDEKKNIKIAIIGVYFGKFPEYFDLWLESCKKNAKIDFFVFTDQEIVNKPKNVKVYEYSLLKMKRRADDVLKFDCSLDSPYKCCDYKPIFGLIFSDYLIGYDYWGHCDFDMLFGDLESYFDKYSLSKYDKFLPLGHLSLYKNTEEVNKRFKSKGAYVDYKTVFTSNDSFGFDEIDGMAAIYYKNHFKFYDKKIFADIDQRYSRFRLSEYCVPKHEKINYKNQIFFWDDGKVYRAMKKNGIIQIEEFCYIHFQKRKTMRLNNVSSDTKRFYITDRGFFKSDGSIIEKDIESLNKYRGILFELFEKKKYDYNLIKKRIVRALKKLFIR